MCCIDIELGLARGVVCELDMDDLQGQKRCALRKRLKEDGVGQQRGLEAFAVRGLATGRKTRRRVSYCPAKQSVHPGHISTMVQFGPCTNRLEGTKKTSTTNTAEQGLVGRSCRYLRSCRAGPCTLVTGFCVDDASPSTEPSKR